MSVAQFREIPFEEIHIKSNVRDDVGDVTELADSIKERGLLSPLLVEANGDGYWLIAGHRRHAALTTLNHEGATPCMVKEVDDVEFLADQIVENLQRVDLNPIEEGRAFQRLIDDARVSQSEVAQLVSRAQSHISRRLSLLRLPANIQRMVAKSEIPVEWGEKLSRVDDPDDIQGLLDRGLSEWSIENVLDRQERDAKLADLHAKGTKAGLPMADMDEVRLFATTGEIFRSVTEAKRHTFGEDEVLVPRFGPEGKPVLAIYEPKTTKGRDSNDPEVRARAVQRHHRKVEREVHARTVQALVPIVAKPKKTVVQAFAVKGIVDLNLHMYARQVCELLDLEVTVTDGTLGRKERDFTGTALGWAEQGETQLYQTALAIVIASTRERMVNDEGLVAEVEAFLAGFEIPDPKDLRLEVEQEFADADAEQAAKREARDAKRAAKEAEAAAAAAAETPEDPPVEPEPEG